MARLEVEIIGDSRSLEKAFARSEKSAKSFNRDISNTGKRSSKMFGGLARGVGLATGAIGVAGLAGAAKAAFGEMADAQKVTAQTEAVLKSTGHAANVSAKQVDELADSLLKKSGVDDEVIKSGENMLLTFTNIRNEAGKGNDVFNQATETLLDMSVATGKDMKSSAIQLGKALQDPAKGITALTRVGVTFTAEQKKTIKTLAATGHTMEAQKMILAELRREFGGSAEAAGKTLPGRLNILRETLLNLGGTIAEKLSPSIIALVDRMTKWLQNSKNQKTILDTINAAVKAVTSVINVLRAAFGVLTKVTGSTTNAIKLLIAAFVVFKGLKMAAAVMGVARSVGFLGTTSTATAGKVGVLNKSLVGKAGLVGAAGLASFALTSLILKATGLDKKLNQLGASAYDAAAKIGLVNDPGGQFAGKAAPTQQLIGRLRDQARRLEAGGLTPAQAAGRIAAAHPNVARRDIDVAAGVGVGGVRPITVNGGVHVHGVRNPRELQDAITKSQRGRPVRRRGDP